MKNIVSKFLNIMTVNDVGNLSPIAVPIIIVTSPPPGPRTVFIGEKFSLRRPAFRFAEHPLNSDIEV